MSEAKYGSSRLIMTADGIQMCGRWRSTRLTRMATEYRSISDSINSGSMRIAGPGGSVGKQRLQISLADGKKVAVFTRARTGASWEFVGPRELLAQAGRQAELVGDYLQQAGEGKVAYESSIYRVVLRDDAMQVTIRDASLLGDLREESGLPICKAISIPLRGARLEQLRAMGRVEIARLLQCQNYPAMAYVRCRRIVVRPKNWTAVCIMDGESWRRSALDSGEATIAVQAVSSRARVVLDVLTGVQSQAEVCRKHILGANLVGLWKSTFLGERGAPEFPADNEAGALGRAGADRRAGAGTGKRMTLENEILKKALRAGRAGHLEKNET